MSHVCNRRVLLRNSVSCALGLTLPSLLRARSVPGARPARADACIVIFLNGGPSHLDMWDMKPHAPAEIRGEFQPIATSVPGVVFSEHLPRLAKNMHHLTLVRSMNHSVNNSHAAAVYAALTGHDRGEQGGGAKPTDHPAPGSVLAKLRPTRPDVLPYIAMPYKTQEGAGGPLQPGFLAGFLGATYDPFWVLDDPNSPQFHVRNLTLPDGLTLERFQQRNALLRRLDGQASRKIDRALAAMDDFQQRAFDLLTSPAAQRAFDIGQEPPALRERYGRNIYGQSVLLARRLIEAGTRLVTISWAPDANATWDTHGDNFRKLKTTLLPQFDAAASSLLEDLQDRGLLERTVVAILGDFGRTPKINNAAGRDHWNACYSIALAGGGFRSGYVHGASDRFGALPESDPLKPGDIIATIYHLLGVDHRTVIYDALNRPHEVVPTAHVVEKLLT
jgi:hypothetical protein